jgi:hypothetical protein
MAFPLHRRPSPTKDIVVMKFLSRFPGLGRRSFWLRKTAYDQLPLLRARLDASDIVQPLA